jgi:anthranilate synthase/aminodeoxychorismate synthase-like glutamine amidotransferase
MILLIDNYDSFTYNIVHYMENLNFNLKVVRNDKITCDEIKTLSPEAIIISPGPETPDNAGICLKAIKTFQGVIPIIGICLGHQAIGQAFGGVIIRGAPIHGKVAQILHDDNTLFKNIPNPFNATRYHSLVIEKDSLPDELIVVARTSDGTIMAIKHRTHNIIGLQFHPESVASECGHEILKNCFDYCNVRAKEIHHQTDK